MITFLPTRRRNFSSTPSSAAAGGLRAACFLLCSLASPALAQDDLPAELRPYRVSLSIGFPQSPAFPTAFRASVREEVRRLIDRTVGERWLVTIVDETAALPHDAIALARMAPATVPVERRDSSEEPGLGLPADSVPDKFLFVTVTPSGPAYVVAAREWDRLSDSMGPHRTIAATTRNDVAHSVVAALHAAFRPVAMIGANGDEAVTILTIRAAGIPTPDPAAAEILPGTLFAPLLRRLDRDGSLVEVRPIPYTLLRLTKAERGTATAEVHSALRSPLGGRRGFVEAWAIAAPPTADATRLTIVRDDDALQLAGRVVEVRPAPPKPGEKEPPAELILLTDRSGSVTLPAEPGRPLVWLTIRSGDAVLMRLPLAPGAEPAVTLRVGDDQRRIDAEGRLAILTGELVETVAKRATLLATARGGARAGRYDEADAALAEAASLPDAAEYRRRLAAIEAPAAKAAEDAGDRLAAVRIRALGRKAAGLIDRYLNPDTLRAAAEEVEELKRTDPDR